MLIVSHVLCGDLDGSALWYSLVQASLVLGLSWTSKDELNDFFTLLYPFLEVLFSLINNSLFHDILLLLLMQANFTPC